MCVPISFSGVLDLITIICDNIHLEELVYTWLLVVCSLGWRVVRALLSCAGALGPLGDVNMKSREVEGSLQHFGTC